YGAIGIGEFVGADGKIGLAGEAGGDRRGSLYEGERGWALGNEDLDWRGFGDAGAAGGNGVEEFDELFGGANGKFVDGVGDDVGVNVVGEIEANGAAARAGAFGSEVRNIGDAGEIGKAEFDASLRAGHVGRVGDRSGFAGRS